MSNKPTSNESIEIYSIKPRYINIRENIYAELSNDAMAVYIALRFEGDYSKEIAKVTRNIQFLCNKAKIGRTRCKECLQELRKAGLLKIIENEGYQSTYLVADELGFFIQKESPKTPPSRQTTTPSRTATTPSRQTTDIINNPFTNTSHLERDKRARAKSSGSEKNLQQIKPAEYKETLYQDMLPVESQFKVTEEQAQTFASFWDMYPRKSNKTGCKHAWFSNGCHNIFDKIYEALKEQIAQDSRFLEGYAPSAFNYITKCGWEDPVNKRSKPKQKYRSLEECINGLTHEELESLR